MTAHQQLFISNLSSGIFHQELFIRNYSSGTSDNFVSGTSHLEAPSCSVALPQAS
jgi:hypothetical protein